MTSQLFSTDQITVPDWCERPLAKVADDRDRQSIAAHGIQQPLVCVADGDRLLLAKGLRRLRIAKGLGMGKVPVIVHKPMAGYTADEYASELRLALDLHRQDPCPSQKCRLIEILKERFGMNNKQVSAYLGIDQDSVTNWLAVRRYIPPVVAALDAGLLTMQAARCFDGLNEKGQAHVWKRHAPELEKGGSDAHQRIRGLYPPDTHARFYANPALTTTRLKQRKRKRGERTTITAAEKRRLKSSLEMKDLELREGTADEKRMKAEIEAAAIPIHAILRSERLVAMLPEAMRDELERFTEIY